MAITRRRGKTKPRKGRGKHATKKRAEKVAHREVAGRKVTRGRGKVARRKVTRRLTGRQHGRMRRTRKRGGTKRSHVAEFAANVTDAHKPTSTTFGSGVRVRAFDASDFLASAYRQGLASRSAFATPPVQSSAAAPRNSTTRTSGTAGSSAAHTSSDRASTGASHAHTSTSSSGTSTIVGRNVSSASDQTDHFNANAYQELIAQEMELRGQYRPGSAPGRGGDDTIISNAVLQTAAESAAEVTVSSAVLKGLGMAVQKLGYDGLLDFVKRGVFGKLFRRSNEQATESSSETEIEAGMRGTTSRDEAAVEAEERRMQDEIPGEGNGSGNSEGNGNGDSNSGQGSTEPENPLGEANTDSEAGAESEAAEQGAEQAVSNVGDEAVEGVGTAIADAAGTAAVDGIESGLEGAGGG